MPRNLSRTAVAMVLAFGLTSLGLAATIPLGTKLADKQELIRNNGSEPDTLDPALAQGVPANNVLRDLFEGLTATDGAGKVVPGVAESWKQTDPTTWVFKLRKDAKWSNGEALTAADFVYALQRFVAPKTASEYAASFGIFLLNGKDIVAGNKPPGALGVKALDNYTLELKTPYPVSFLPELVSNTQMGPVHKATVDKFGKD
ncbi:MAG: peptide ABC transporter substrate-binding protein, partial [Rhodoferax sp.]|nr:peptide ABC transporter substrate-binding protein [Rhodoferax sp.]